MEDSLILFDSLPLGDKQKDPNLYFNLYHRIAGLMPIVWW